MKNVKRISILLSAFVILGSLMLMAPKETKAGIFNAGEEVTYKEYWVHHNQFTGGCNDDGTPTSPGGSWYLEPYTLVKCPKTVNFTLPDDFTNAVKIEVYLDLWRNYTIQAANFYVNNDDIVYHPPVGNDWSRTPYILEIDKSEFNVGANTMTFWGDKKYHIHDIGIRIYYDDSSPLLPGPGSDVQPPNGQLTSIEDDNGSVNPNAGGTLTVNSNKLKLTADISADTAYVEFHAWYEGYDEDNDGVFRDWHNSGRNNWWPGGKEEIPTGGVINHIGTVKPKSGVTTVSYTWNLGHITNQARIKFKIRVVDTAGNVREAAGGPSANFKMMRSAPVNAFLIHDFTDYGLHMNGSRPDIVTYDFYMPDNVTTQFTTAYLVGAYWKNPNFSINNNSASTVSSPDWALGVKAFNINYMTPGKNKIAFLYTGGSGHFIEKPGPMFVLSRNNAVTDNTPPAVSKQNPAPNATNVDVKSPILANVGDTLFGVDWTTVVMTVNGEDVTNKARLEGVMGDYRLVYRPVSGKLEFSTEYNVKIDACDLVGNCMPSATYKFTTADPDTTPPVISNIVVEALPNGANVSWVTNEPAAGRIEYGKTTNYELGVVEGDGTLKTSHYLEIRGLQPDTSYNLRIKATDEQGNTGQSSNQPFHTLEFGQLLSDDFNSCVLDTSLWEVIDPKGDLTYFMNGEQIELTIPGGSSHDWTVGSPPRLMQTAADEDFSVEIKFETQVALPGQHHGVLIEEDADTFARISYEFPTTAGATPIIYARFMKDGVNLKNFSYTLPADKPVPMALKITRTGDSYNWFYLDNGLWKKPPGAPYTAEIVPLKIGFYAGNSGTAGTQPGFKSVVDYFFNSDLPIVPEDGSPMSVNITQIGTGTITKQPDKPKYICGDEVQISASTIPGWSFEGLTGDVNSTAPITNVTINAPKFVTATFTQDQYLLDVTIQNDGIGGAGNVVNKSPDQPTYVYGDQVQLTAVPEPGWKFVGWSGSVTGTNPTVSITMFKSEAVTARFEQEQYELNVNVVHNGIGTGGSISMSPTKATFLYGDVVTLSATPKPGWSFGGWSGGTTSSALSTQLTITGDTNVTATFNQIKYDIDINIIGDGSITLDPQKDYYLYGDQVSLVADGGTCWTFKQWSGDLNSNNSVEFVTITDNLSINAEFTQKEHTLVVNKVGPGNFSITPDKPKYLCGEEVTLWAVPAPSNFFAGWTGDQVSAENPLTFAIEKNTVVTANFTSNPPPTVDPIPNKTVIIGQLVTFQVKANDSQGESLTLSAVGLPPGASFKDNGNGTGTFTWRPGISQTGDFSITFNASDGIGLGSATVNIQVKGTAVVLPIIIRP